MNHEVTIDTRRLWATGLTIGGAVCLMVLVWAATVLARWHCEQRLAWMGFRGTTPPYSVECHVAVENRGMVPLAQIRWVL
jgi:hypothetical protein